MDLHRNTKRYWTKDNCREEALKYKSLTEFNKGCKAAYMVARKNCWIDEYTWLEHRYKPNGFWNRENCYEEAKKYKSKVEFQRCSGSAYVSARKNGWLVDYDWFEKPQRPVKWTFESCFEEAKKYKTKREFEKSCSRAYALAIKNGWIKDYTWFQEVRKPNGYWTKENCEIEARKYKTRSEFKKFNGVAYQTSYDNGWIDDYTWFEQLQKPNGYWTEERCRKEAMKYQTRAEFSRKSVQAYKLARLNHWLESYVWLVNKNLYSEKGKRGVIYIYIFNDHNTAYVGWTINPKQRDAAHRDPKKPDSICIFAKEHGLEVPPMEIIEEHLTPFQARERENFYINHYRELGYSLLNKAKGGSVGKLGAGKWNKSSCYKEALKYNTRLEFQQAPNGAYEVARKNGWLDDYTWFQTFSNPKGYWTYERCVEESRKYKTRSEFSEKASGAYQAAYENKWLDDFVWLVSPKKEKGFWTRENCYEEAKKYKSKTEFHHNCNRAYKIATQNGWISDYTWFDNSKRRFYWNEDRCREEAMKYTSKSAFAAGNASAYNVARKNGWLSSYNWFVRNKKTQ